MCSSIIQANARNALNLSEEIIAQAKNESTLPGREPLAPAVCPVARKAACTLANGHRVEVVLGYSS